MKFSPSWCAAALVFVCLLRPAFAQAPSSLKVVQWNVFHNGKGTDNLIDRGRQVEWLAGRAPDIVSMNEVISSGATDYKNRLTAATGVQWYAYFAPFQADGTGNLILTRYPILSTSKYLMQTNGQYSRGIAQATIDVNGVAISFFSVHLDNSDSTIRAAQAKETAAFMARFAEPRILAGDLNAAPQLTDLQSLFTDYVDTWSAAIASGTAFAYPPDNPVAAATRTQWSRIDYVLASDRQNTFAIAASEIPDIRDLTNTNVVVKIGTSDDKGVRPSDHNMVITTFNLQAATTISDTVGPAVALATPADASSLTGIVTLHADASDDAGVSKVVFLVDGAPVATVRTSPFEYAWNTAAVALGAHTIEAIAADAAGNQTSSGPVVVTTAAVPSAAGDVVVYASDATTAAGSWLRVDDSRATAGVRIQNPDAAASTISTPLASPTTYLDVPFVADAGKPYHLWIHGVATNNSYKNDSVYVQFSGSVTASGAPIYRIGTTSATTVTLEDCSGCGLSGWGWQDNGYGAGVLGPQIYFSTTGPQVIRIQVREDGLGIDQIVLSPTTYLTVPPGTTKNDLTWLSRTYAPDSTSITPPPPPPPPPSPPSPSSSSDVVLYATDAPLVIGNWSVVTDTTAAGGALMQNADLGAAKISAPLASPSNYVELAFAADAGKPYHLWVRGKALNNYWANDSVFVQFSDSVDAAGSAVYRIGTTAGATVNVEDCSGCGLSGWGWQDNGYGAGVFGPNVYFATSGSHTIRLQVREDGLGFDQIVLSPSTYLTTSPGALKNDTTILPKQ